MEPVTLEVARVVSEGRVLSTQVPKVGSVRVGRYWRVGAPLYVGSREGRVAERIEGTPAEVAAWFVAAAGAVRARKAVESVMRRAFAA
jgi:hypothetical protein